MAQEDVDGIFGTATEKRILEVIATGEEPMESVKVDTAQDFWKDIRYFTRAEFRCPCGRCGGFPVEPDETLVRLADRVRAHFGTPATVSSGVRCQAYNDELPGSSKNSYHVKGKAMDFCVRGVSGDKLLAYIKTLPIHYAPSARMCPLQSRTMAQMQHAGVLALSHCSHLISSMSRAQRLKAVDMRA